MINDMGINVFESAPDTDALLLAEADTDEAAAEEEAAAALAAVETDIGRTTDPVRMYMREMGTVELLTREGEIEIAKRIEGEASARSWGHLLFPGTVDSILAEYQRVTTEGGRLSDVLSGYIDPDDGSQPTRGSRARAEEANGRSQGRRRRRGHERRRRRRRWRPGSGKPPAASMPSPSNWTRPASGPQKPRARQQAAEKPDAGLAELFMPIAGAQAVRCWPSAFAACWSGGSRPGTRHHPGCAYVTHACRAPTSSSCSRQ